MMTQSIAEINCLSVAYASRGTKMNSLQMTSNFSSARKSYSVSTCSHLTAAVLVGAPLISLQPRRVVDPELVLKHRSSAETSQVSVSHLNTIRELKGQLVPHSLAAPFGPFVVPPERCPQPRNLTKFTTSFCCGMALTHLTCRSSQMLDRHTLHRKTLQFPVEESIL